MRPSSPRRGRPRRGGRTGGRAERAPGGPGATLLVSAQLTEIGGTTRYESPNNTGVLGVNDYTGLTWVEDGMLVLADGASNATFGEDLRVGDGPVADSRATAYRGKDMTGGTPQEKASFDAFPGFLGGVFMG